MPKVWIDQDLCTGDGLCEEIAPDVFFGHDDGLFYVREVGTPVPKEPTHRMGCLLYTSPSPRDLSTSRMPSSA